MIANDLKIVPEYWYTNETDNRNRYSYIAPDNTLWNIDNWDENNMIHLWSITAWGNFVHKAVNYYEFMAFYREYQL